MQRYHAASCTSAVNNSAVGGTPARDTARADSSSLSANLSLNPRLGPPDYYPQTSNCPEETLTREYVQSGYKETVEGLEEAREISLTQVQTFTKPIVLKCKEAIRKRLKAINESRAQKRKAGQVYGVPLSSSLLTKPGLYPEQKPCTEDFRKRWIEGLSQPHKRLRTLADQIPHGFRRKYLFDVLIRNNVPLLRATWFVKVTYLNQVKPVSSSISSGAPDKIQLSRTELWTKDVIEYLQYLLDEFFPRNNNHSTHSRDRSPQILYAGRIQHKSDPASGTVDGKDPSLHFKWWYVVRILQWHHAEGLLLPSPIIDWVLKQLQEKELLEILQLLLPIIYGVIETVVLSQTYVRILVRVAVRFIRESSPGGSDLVDNSRRAYTTAALIEMLRYLILAVPDTFVALDCFPLPPCVVTYRATDVTFLSKVYEDAGKSKSGLSEVSYVFRDKGIDAQYQPALDEVVSSIQKRAHNLADAASPGYQAHSVAKAVQALDKALVQGDVREAYKFLFEDLCDGFDESWIAEVNTCLKSSLKWISTVRLSFICSVFFLCEWATCDFRDYRTSPPHDLKFSGRRDFSQVNIAIRLLKLKLRDMESTVRCKNNSTLGFNSLAKGVGQQNNGSGKTSVENVCEIEYKSKCVNGGSIDLLNTFQSPGSLHDIIVCWIDQHEAHKEGFKRVQLLIMELIRSGIFYPQAYVRQLLVSGYMDKNGPVIDLGRRKRHHRILKQLPASYIHNVLGESQITEVPLRLEAMHIYSNERRLVLHGLIYHEHKNLYGESISSQKQKHHRVSLKGGSSPTSLDVGKGLQSCTSSNSLSGKNVKSNTGIEELKAAISVLLQFPNSSSRSTDFGLDESQGNVKRPVGLVCNKIDQAEVTPGCDECKRVKRQKISEERNSYLQRHSPNLSDDEDTWWVRKGLKSFESFKVEPPLKPNKQPSRGRQKMVRKTQSLAQLASARIEGSQGASTSHVCDNRISCPRHRAGIEGEAPKLVDDMRKSHCRDFVSIGKSLKELSFLEKMTISVWLITVVRQCVEDVEKNPKVGQYSRLFPDDERSSSRWKLGEEELSDILYLMDVCNNLVPAVRFLLWLLPKAAASSGNSTIHSGRNMIMLPRNEENHVCQVGEEFLLSSIRRYENILVATNLIPEALSAAMHRAAKVMAANGRISGSVALVFSRYLLRKYGNVSSVIEWENDFKATCNKSLFSELESARSLDGEFRFPVGVPAGVEDLDDFIRQKITSGRLSRVGLSMREIVQKHVDDAFHYFLAKEKKQFAAGTPKGPAIEKWDYGSQIAQQIIVGLMESIRQTGGAAQEGDPSLVSSAVSAIVCNVGPAMAKLSDFTAGSSFLSFPSTTGSTISQHILRIHISCLSLLKDALGERQSRIFEIALASEASSVLTGVFAPGKAPRNQYQLSSESLDSNSNMSNEFVNNSAKVVIGRATKVTAAVSALVIGAVVHGVTSLERMVTVFRLKEGLDLVQFVRSTKSNSNGNSRSVGVLKVENSIEIYVHWFRLLVGNCRTLSDGLIVVLLGEPYIVALSRMQRTLPVSLVFPPAYSMFAFVIWRPYLLSHNIATHENTHQLYQSIALAIGDAIKHLPFRDVCLRDTRDFYDLVLADAGDAEFAAMLDLNVLDLKSRINIIVPLRARLFLNALVDCRMPQTTFSQDDGNHVSLLGESKRQCSEKEPKLLDKIVHVLDALQPAKLHWQWIELRLLLNEQALHEKVDNHDMPLPDAIRSLLPNPEKSAASENENNFIQIILTRLLVRPDAAPLFSEVVHLLGRSLEDSMLMQTKWFLGGQDVLLGRKSIRQRLVNIAESKGLSMKAQFWKPWGWSKSSIELVSNRGDKRKFEVSSLEEGEVVEEGIDLRRYGRGSTHVFDVESFNVNQQHVTERALVELVLPCIDQSSKDSRNTFASDLIKQMNNIEQQISAVTRGAIKQAGTNPSGIEGPANKGNNRKGIRGGSPGLARRQIGATESAPPSPAALRASMSLRLQFILRLLPAICVDGDPSVRNMRHMLASVILRLLGSRVVHEDANLSFYTMRCSLSKREAKPPMEASPAAAASVDLSSEYLFDRLLLVLHGLLSSSKPSWLKSKCTSNSTNEFIKDFSGIDRDVADSLQNDLNRMQLPDAIRWRIQAAMPMLLPSVRCFISCQTPSIPPGSLASLQPGISIYGLNPGNSHTTLRNSVSPIRATNISGKPKLSPLPHDHDTEIDPWTLLEDGAGSGPSSSNIAVISSSDHANLRASSWLKGAVRVRRTDLTYIGSVDDDS